MAALTLFHISPSRSSTVLWMLEELGEPYDIHLLDMKKGENRQPAYLVINPMGKVPAVKHGDAVITEAAAICGYLADAFPKAGLAPPIGDARRGPYLKWLFFGPSCYEPALIEVSLKREPAPRATAGWGDLDSVLNVIEGAIAKGPWLFGDQFTAADVVIGSGIRWGLMWKLLPERPDFAAYADRLNRRAAAQRATAKDKELAPKPT